MSNEYNKIGENICQAVDIITSQKLNDIPYDKTEICTIVKQNEKNDNIYTVTNGVITFDAIVDLNPNSKDTPKYKKNDCVRVLIPNGNYKDFLERNKFVERKEGNIVDKDGNINVLAGKLSFTNDQLVENIMAIYDTIAKSHPAAVKGHFIKNYVLSSTMGPGIKVEIVR